MRPNTFVLFASLLAGAFCIAGGRELPAVIVTYTVSPAETPDVISRVGVIDSGGGGGDLVEANLVRPTRTRSEAARSRDAVQWPLTCLVPFSVPLFGPCFEIAD